MPKQTRNSRGGTARAAHPIAKSAATRRRILDAAAWALLNYGYAATRLEDIADRAGLQAGSLYYYFDSKDQLVEEVLRYGVQFNHAHVRAALDQVSPDATPGERLAIVVGAYLEGMLELGDLGPAHVRTFNQVPPAMQERLRPVRQGFGRLWATLVDDAIAAGEIRDDLDPYIVRLFITQSLERVAEWHLRRPLAAAELSKIVRSMIFDGIGVPAAP
jgi:TetR/AcrR family transcriptional regulator, cholesterol catabolism regulator